MEAMNGVSKEAESSSLEWPDYVVIGNYLKYNKYFYAVHLIYLTPKFDNGIVNSFICFLILQPSTSSESLASDFG